MNPCCYPKERSSQSRSKIVAFASIVGLLILLLAAYIYDVLTGRYWESPGVVVDKYTVISKTGNDDQNVYYDYVIEFEYEVGFDSKKTDRSTYGSISVGDTIIVECVYGGLTGINYVTGVRVR